MFVAYPSADGTVVGSGYVMKVWFSKSLANNLSTADLLKPLRHQDRQHRVRLDHGGGGAGAIQLLD